MEWLVSGLSFTILGLMAYHSMVVTRLRFRAEILERRADEIEKAAKATQELVDHAYLLDRVLTDLITRSVIDRNIPAWKAWCQTMGVMTIAVESERRFPE